MCWSKALTFGVGSIQLSFHTIVFTCKGVFNPNVTTFQSNCAKGLHFNAFHCKGFALLAKQLHGFCSAPHSKTSLKKPHKIADTRKHTHIHKHTYTHTYTHTHTHTHVHTPFGTHVHVLPRNEVSSQQWSPYWQESVVCDTELLKSSLGKHIGSIVLTQYWLHELGGRGGRWRGDGE